MSEELQARIEARLRRWAVWFAFWLTVAAMVFPIYARRVLIRLLGPPDRCWLCGREHE